MHVCIYSSEFCILNFISLQTHCLVLDFQSPTSFKKIIFSVETVHELSTKTRDF